ncbi:MAG TPA: hypothetical protein VIM84_04205, partial [Gemmatimonadales bacterium]
SITGVEGPLGNGNCRGSCGQTGIPDDLHPAMGGTAWAPETVASLHEIWDRWHLNDMRAGCEHQRAAWDTQEVLTLIHLAWGDAYHEQRRRAEDGAMSVEEYAIYAADTGAVFALATDYNAPKHPDLWGTEGEALLSRGLLKVERTEEKAAGWVSPREHPEGLLGKPCEICGYHYGSAWLYEDVPADVLEFLRALPDDADQMPAAWRR